MLSPSLFPADPSLTDRGLTSSPSREPLVIKRLYTFPSPQTPQMPRGLTPSPLPA